MVQWSVHLGFWHYDAVFGQYLVSFTLMKATRHDFFAGLITMKTMSRKLAMPLLGVLLWVLSIHAGTFAAATLLPPPVTGTRRTYTIDSFTDHLIVCHHYFRYQQN